MDSDTQSSVKTNSYFEYAFIDKYLVNQLLLIFITIKIKRVVYRIFQKKRINVKDYFEKKFTCII